MPNGLGRHCHYQGGSIYWHRGHPSEAFEFHGLFLQKWSHMGWEQSSLGFSLSDERASGTTGGRISLLEERAIACCPDLGTHEILPLPYSQARRENYKEVYCAPPCILPTRLANDRSKAARLTFF